MYTRWLMTAAALWMAVLGVGATFLPQELLAHGGVETKVMAVLLVQVVGALHLGFAMLDWAARGNLIGGIYSRPVAVANFTHFAVVTITLIKLAVAGGAPPAALGFTLVYILFAAAFGKVLLTHPAPKGAAPGN